MNGNDKDTPQEGVDPPEPEDEEELEEEAEEIEGAEPEEEAEEEVVQALGPEDDDEAEFDETVLECHTAATEQLMRLAAESDGAIESEDAFEGAGNIVGVGLGFADEAEFSSAEPGAGALNVYVVEECSIDDIKSALVDDMGLSAASSDDFPINLIVSGPIDADSHRFRIRPAPGGVSCGHFRITAGTLGCLARGRRSPRNRRILVLSNNHVLAASNGGRFGDPILQPGRADGGRNPRDRIAILERYARIRFGGRVCNYVDCATGWAWPRRVRRELIYRSPRGLRLFRISSRVRACRRNLLVGKTGRTTQLRVGRITDCAANMRINYGRGRVALFCRQIVIRGVGRRRPFSAGGDSGSVIWTWDRRRNPVGLLFAGNSTNDITIANHMTHVLRALDINLYT